MSDPPERWRALGFSVDGGLTSVGGVSVSLGVTGRGIAGWSVSQVESEVDGLPVLPPPAAPAAPCRHANGATGIDHLVVLTPDFDRTVGALEAAGLPLRRVVERPDGTRMGFRRIGPAILELVQDSRGGGGPAHFWGLVLTVADLESLAERLGSRLGPIKPAVQPGRRIATLRDSAGLHEAVAFMDGGRAPDR